MAFQDAQASKQLSQATSQQSQNTEVELSAILTPHVVFFRFPQFQKWRVAKGCDRHGPIGARAGES